ncbi:MAG: hypothetical protein BGN86_00810 [Caulobacterales bacterium 68-7]|nr:MAG: hypothetical protein BGN86_00810 [Caulobacterales bacterium 68-7]
MNPAEIESFILENLPVAPAPGLPEIRLHLAGPASRLTQLQEAGSPYWARTWGGGIALAMYLRDHPETVAGRRVLDLGCGSGLVAIAAALAGAEQVSAVDLDPRALIATRLNAHLNGVNVTAEGTPPPAHELDLILAGDVFYDPQVSIETAATLDAWAAAGVPTVVGDPWRRALPKARLRRMADYDVMDFGGAAMMPAAVFEWIPSPD